MKQKLFFGEFYFEQTPSFVTIAVVANTLKEAKLEAQKILSKKYKVQVRCGIRAQFWKKKSIVGTTSLAEISS